MVAAKAASESRHCNYPEPPEHHVDDQLDCSIPALRKPTASSAVVASTSAPVRLLPYARFSTMATYSLLTMSYVAPGRTNGIRYEGVLSPALCVQGTKRHQQWPPLPD